MFVRDGEEESGIGEEESGIEEEESGIEAEESGIGQEEVGIDRQDIILAHTCCNEYFAMRMKASDLRDFHII